MNQIEDENVYDPNILPDLLPIYYKRLFPHIPFYRWMAYGSSESAIFTNREFSFVLPGDIYIRYLSFENQNEFEKELCSRNPQKIDIGAVMNIRPKEHRGLTIQPIQKELVFDIDMTDYDDVRKCCQDADICIKCWKYMAIACKVIDIALRDDFGFEHLLWVFSGRRGIHCWVCDQTARHLKVDARCTVAEYFQLFTNSNTSDQWARMNIGEDWHHSIKRAFRICEPMFEEICLIDQNLFGTPNGISKLLKFIPDENLRNELEPKLCTFENDSISVWKTFSQFFENVVTRGPSYRRFIHIVEEVQLALLYPRLDINVTKGLNHLLKAPFCVHPKTGKICVPFNVNIVDKFDPSAVPTITSLLNEINSFDQKKQTDINNKNDIENESRIKDYRKTGMYKGIRIFEEFLRKIEVSLKGKAKLIDDVKMEF